MTTTLPNAPSPSSDLGTFLRKEILKHGPISLERYFEICLAHPEYGYYITRDPLGEDGDFTTAPEISQMFGEIIGAWAGDLWSRNRQGPTYLLECGPGRGTLSADILRVTHKIPGFWNNIILILLETSPALRRKQTATLNRLFNAVDCPPPPTHFINSITELPADRPVISIANEFLDALPVRQILNINGQLREKAITCDTSGALSYTDIAYHNEPDIMIKPGQCLEVSPVRANWLSKICAHIATTGGAGLFIDYGYSKPQPGDSFQAIQNHKPIDPLATPGEADLTAHVDFSQIIQAANSAGLGHLGPVEQGSFLKHFGIEQRANSLTRANPDQTSIIQEALHRLTHPQEMGQIFKCCGVFHKNFAG